MDLCGPIEQRRFYPRRAPPILERRWIACSRADSISDACEGNDALYLDTAAEGLPPDHLRRALTSYHEDKSSGTPGRRNLHQVEAEALQAAACLLRTSAQDIAFLSSASEGLNLLANSIAWRSGDEVLITDLEFASNILVWLRLKELGVRLRVVHSESGMIQLEQLESQIGRATRLVSISQVSYKTGTQIRFLPELAQAIHRVGGILCVDATQALGRVPVSVDGIDYLVASSYKWLLGVHGLGIVFFAPELQERLLPGAVGWYSVQELFGPDRFENFKYKEGAARLASFYVDSLVPLRPRRDLSSTGSRSGPGRAIPRSAHKTLPTGLL
jgi:selenocysteine lyase/cysteine desulfurase